MTRLLTGLAAAFLYLTLPLPAQAQVYFTKAGKAHFFSEAPLENIEATTKQAECAFAPKSGQISARIKVNTFQFDKALMQRHFNENYLESDKYPYATLEAKLVEPLPLDKDGMIPVTLTGKMTIHGVTKEYTFPGEVEVKNGQPVRAKAKWTVALVDHKIEIPKMVVKNIAETIAVDVDFALEKK